MVFWEPLHGNVLKQGCLKLYVLIKGSIVPGAPYFETFSCK
jgi:hypothetical protein